MKVNKVIETATSYINKFAESVENVAFNISFLIFKAAFVVVLFPPLLLAFLPWVVFYYDHKIGGKALNWIWWVENLVLVIIGALIHNLKHLADHHSFSENYIAFWWVLLIIYNITWVLGFIYEFAKGWFEKHPPVAE